MMQKNKEVGLPSGSSNGILNGGHTEAITTTQVIRNFSSPPLNLGSQSWGGPPQADTSIHRLLKPTPGHTDPEAIFLGTTSATWPEDELQKIVETEVAPIELEDDNSQVICPTCYDFIPRARYSSHTHSKGCYLPARPSESTGESSHELCHRTSKGKNHSAWSELAGKHAPAQKIEWSHAARPLVIQRIKQSDMQYWSTARDKMTAIYRAALRKPNVDGTYNVNGQVTSLQELKRKIWNSPRRLKTNI